MFMGPKPEAKVRTSEAKNNVSDGREKKRLKCDTNQDSGSLSRQDLFMEVRVSNLQISHHYLPKTGHCAQRMRWLAGFLAFALCKEVRPAQSHRAYCYQWGVQD